MYKTLIISYSHANSDTNADAHTNPSSNANLNTNSVTDPRTDNPIDAGDGNAGIDIH
ncbi:hypothetical protein [Halopenitus sp. POP-27]|uniref:hypothetical protein n=1 Tax=Halopenitus sp. POP-27 TaxID=2994425 RepID=UPI00246886D4|nr:hypothetical protein [Halopenitus sp. POP-27]